MCLNLISISECAKYFDKPVSTIYSWKRNGNLPSQCFKKIGGSVFVSKIALEEYINSL